MFGERYTNKRLVHRVGGKYAKEPPINVGVCQHCRVLIVPSYENVGSKAFPMMKRTYPTHCHSCGKPIQPESRTND